MSDHNGSMICRCPDFAAVLLSLLVTSLAWCDVPDFNREVQPILSEHCYQCHGPDEAAREADLRLDQREGLLSVAGAAHDSELLRRIVSDDPDEIMPPVGAKNPLTPEEKALIRDWLDSGAKWEAHWSFVKPTRPSLPARASSTSRSTSNAIDLFVDERLQKERLNANGRASAERLLRRVTLDLTGLPPTIEELDAFVTDSSDESYSAAVNRLLSSPRFGERMAMEWLDAARYADTNGYQGDRERTMWPWRDWVIDAFNRNMPYDEFTVWQLAGDMLPNATDHQRLATGFCRNHMINGEGGRIAEENRVEYIFDQIETVGTVWMGLTVQCCRCHDHKFEPISQDEYFQLFAFFNQTPVSGGGGDPQMAPNMLVVPESEKQELAERRQAAAANRKQLEAAESGMDKTSIDRDSDVAKALGEHPSQRNEGQWKTLESHFAGNVDLLERMKRYRTSKRALDQATARLPKVMVMQDQALEKRRETFVLEKGLYNQRRHKVTAATPAFLPPSDSSNPNRLTLAQWLVSPEHPLTARVTVNRIWQTFFGTGLVKTAEDFGVQGEKPSHPELLDWLAVEFVESGWNLKQLVRLIVTSSAYQRSAHATADQLEQDPENRLLARGPRMRMPAWMIRDHALFVSGAVTPNVGGPPVNGYQPAGIWEDASFGKKKYSQDHGEKLYRRSLYTFWRRIVGPTMFFDMSKRQTCSVRSGRTNTPLHALVTLNDVTYVEAARLLALRVMGARSEDRDRIALAFRLAASRAPKDAEVRVLERRLDTLKTHFAENENATVQLLAIGESRAVMQQLDASEAEVAAFTTIALTILNLDEALCK